jgi:hypothetical protein
MSRMLGRSGRWLRTIFALVMLLLWLIAGALWIRSYWRADEIALQTHSPIPNDLGRYDRSRQYLLFAGRGGICLARRDFATLRITQQPLWKPSENPGYPQPWSAPATARTVSLQVSRFNNAPQAAVATRAAISSTLSLMSTTAPSSAVPSFPASRTIQFSASSVTISSPITVNMPLNGTVNVSPQPRGAVPLAPTIPTAGSLALTNSAPTMGGVVFITWSGGNLPLPPPNPIPRTTLHFLAYRAGDAQNMFGHANVVIFPMWAPFLLMTLLTALALRNESGARLRRRRARTACCIACGYDLRASPDRCPECGSVPSPAV